MKRTAILAAIVVAGLSLAAAAQNPGFPPVGDAQKIKDNLWVIPGEGGNTAAFATANGVVLVDTKLAKNGQAILAKLKAVTPRPVTTIINTHTHGDHVGSNGEFPASVEIIAHENTRANMMKMAELKAAPSALPDRAFQDRLTLGSGADQIDLYYFGAGHTNGDAFVVFTAARTVHTGDIFAWKAPPFIDSMNGGSFVAAPETLEKAAKGLRNVDSVITGHMGDVQPFASLAEYAEFNREFLNYVQAARKAGKTAEQAAMELKLPAKFDAYIGPAVIPGVEFLGPARPFAQKNVMAAYAELNARR
jgi:glyoxylase-like metal-dependent hydrolase (beta-lactamase superfamily II)